MITIAVVNTKGGVGKTTICASLAVRASRDSARVAALDLDPQLSLVEWSKRRGKGNNPTIFEGVCDVADAVERAYLAGYDWLFLDGPPAILQAVQDSIGVADFTLIPVKPSMVDLLATQDTVAIATDAGVPLLCVFNDVASGEKVVESAKTFLFSHKVSIAKAVIIHRVSHVKGMAVGKSAAEVNNGRDTAAAKDIDELWHEIKAAATKAVKGRAKRKAAANV
jgi:chromosome partitioning protein